MNQALTTRPTTMSGLPELLTLKEAAELLDTDVHVVLGAVDAGSLAALRLGPDVRIPRRTVAAALTLTG